MTLTPLTVRRLSAAVVHLAGGKHALVDESDWELVSGYSWHVTRGYVQSRDRRDRRFVSMPRLILSTTERVGHRNDDTLDNRRSNLRVENKQQSLQGARPHRRRKGKSSRYKGVSWHRSRRRWVAYIRADGHNLHLGHFRSEDEAARVYDVAAVKYFGEFARLNFSNQTSRAVSQRLHCQG